jgi:hypothetical protein
LSELWWSIPLFYIWMEESCSLIYTMYFPSICLTNMCYGNRSNHGICLQESRKQTPSARSEHALERAPSQGKDGMK